MAGNTKEARLRLTLIDGVSLNAALISKSLNRLNRNVNAITHMATFAAGYVGVTQAIEGTVSAARKFEAQLREIAIKGDLSEAAMKMFGHRISGLSPITNQTTDDLTKAADAMVSYGLDTARTAESLPAIGRAATASGAAIDDLAKSSATLMQSFNVDPKEIAKALDMMVEAGNQGAFELRDMSQYFPALVAGARSLGMEGTKGVADIAAALEIARRGAGDSATAANNLQNLLQKSLSQTTLKNFRKFGIDVRKELERAAKKGVSPLERLIELVDKTTKGGRADLLGKLFEDKQVQEALRPLMHDLEDYRRMRSEIEKSDGAAARAYARRMDNANEKLKAFNIRMQNFGRALGERALDPLGKTAGRITYILDTLDRRAGAIDKMKAAAGGFAKGLGFESAEAALTRLGEVLENSIFGKIDDQVGDRLGRIFERFRQWGDSVRQFTDAVAVNPIGKFLGEMTGQGFKLTLAATGISLLAGALWKLARAAAFLSGLSTVASIVKGLGRVGGLLSAGVSSTAAGGGGGIAAAGATKGGSWLARWLSGAGIQDLVGSGRSSSQLTAFEKFGQATGILGRAAGRILGMPLIAGEVTTRALLAKGPADKRFVDPAYSAWAMRNTEDRAAGRPSKPAPAASQPVPFSFGQLWNDLTGPVEGFGRKADEVSKKATEALSINVKPIIDTSSLDMAARKAANFLSSMRAIGAVAPSVAPPPSGGGVGHRATGGAVRRGLTYEINERGTETVTMGTNGYVTPAHKVGQGGGVHIENLSIHGANADEVLKKLDRALTRALDRSRQTSIDGRPVTI